MAIHRRDGAFPMGQIGAEQKQLNRAQQQRQDPEQQQVGHRVGRQPIEQQGAHQPAAEQGRHLPWAEVLRHEAEIPGQQISVLAIVVIGVERTGWRLVMALMVAAAALPGQAGIKAQGQAAEPIVPAWRTG